MNIPFDPRIIDPSPVRRWWTLFGALSLVLLVPLFVTEIPPLLDYPNHLARMEILAHETADPVLARIYRAEWTIVPNIGIDLAMPALMRVLPLYLAGKVFVALALLLPLLGVAALSRAVFNTPGYWPLAAGLVAYNRLLFAGFLNFLIGVGLALLAAALWETLRQRPVARVVSGIAAGLAIFFCHLIALAFYGLLLTMIELGHAVQARPRSPRLGRLALLALPFAAPAVLYLHAPIGRAAADGGGGGGIADTIRHYYWALAASWNGLKPYGLIGPFLTYDRRLDAAAIVLVVLLIAGFAAQRRLEVARPIVAAFAVLLLAYPFVPFFLMETAWVDQRLPILAGFLLFAGLYPKVPSRRTALAVTLAIAATIIARTADICEAWAGHDAVLADFRTVIAPVGAGDTVLVVQAERNADPAAMVNNPDSVRAMRENDATMHLPALLVIEHRAFWPLLFTAAAKQPVRVNPPFDALSLPEGELPWVGALSAPDADTLKRAPYLADWQKKFDWVLLLHPGDAPSGYDLLPDRLDKAVTGDVAALYRVKR
jgi:hypothetical protein